MVSEARNLWSGCSSKLIIGTVLDFHSVGVPLLYMVVVVPLGFLVNTEDGYHYGLRTAANGQIQA